MATDWFSAPAPVVRQVQAYFAPVDRKTQTPVSFDMAVQGSFKSDEPPAPWINLGRIEGFTRTSSGKRMFAMAGIPAAVQEQVRESLEAQVSFQFITWTKLTMALATGSQHMNVLSSAQGEERGSEGTRSAPAVAIQSGATASFLPIAAEGLAEFLPGSMVAVDEDYGGQTGFIGTPVSGAYVRQPLVDVDYIRRITWNVGLVAEVSATGLVLAAPLAGGVPQSSAKAQAICGFVDRMGGTFFQEWSALFLLEGSQGERILFHYPRLQACMESEEMRDPLTGKGNLERVLLKARFTALPIVDPADGERILCYRTFMPACKALV